MPEPKFDVNSIADEVSAEVPAVPDSHRILTELLNSTPPIFASNAGFDKKKFVDSITANLDFTKMVDLAKEKPVFTKALAERLAFEKAKLEVYFATSYLGDLAGFPDRSAKLVASTEHLHAASRQIQNSVSALKTPQENADYNEGSRNVPDLLRAVDGAYEKAYPSPTGIKDDRVSVLNLEFMNFSSDLLNKLG